MHIKPELLQQHENECSNNPNPTKQHGIVNNSLKSLDESKNTTKEKPTVL